MALYSCHFKIVGRSNGNKATAAAAYVSGSVVAGAAYRAGEKLRNEYNDHTYDYTSKTEIVHSEIMLPENAPREFLDRSTLWNAVELKDNRCDSQLARECRVALPVEFSLEEQIEALREYISRNFVSKGVCADFSIHDKGDGNPHAHIMLTLRDVSEKGFGARRAEEQGKGYFQREQRLLGWREDWAKTCNKHLEKKGTEERIDHRTLEAQGIDRIPTIHLGKDASQLEKQGIQTDRGNINREIQRLNQEREISKTQPLKELPTRAETDKTITADMTRLKNEYAEKTKKIEVLTLKQRLFSENEQKIREFDIKLDGIIQYEQEINGIDKKINTLYQEQQKTSIFRIWQRLEIKKEIEALKKMKAHESALFEKTYNIRIENADILANQLEEEYRALTELNEKMEKSSFTQNRFSVDAQANKLESAWERNKSKTKDFGAINEIFLQRKTDIQAIIQENTVITRDLTDLKDSRKTIATAYKRLKIHAEKYIEKSILETTLKAYGRPRNNDERNFYIYAENKLNIISPEEYKQITGRERASRANFSNQQRTKEHAQMLERERQRKLMWER